MTATKLTTHQAEVLSRIYRRCVKPADRLAQNPAVTAVDSRQIGSRAAVWHLVHKGYVEVSAVRYGPRGGEYWLFVPTSKGCAHERRRIARNIALKEATS